MWSKFDEMPVIYGELKERILLNMARLSAPCYRPSAIYTEDKAGWPGDWEGRTLLALVSHLVATGVEPAYLKQIAEEIPSHFNKLGYLCKIQPSGIFDEQQLSGHNWLIRGYMEYYLKTGEEKFLEIVSKIVKNLYLPLIGWYHTYPLDPEKRAAVGEAAGTVQGAIDHWFVSSDVGCAFMCLDGLSQYYEITRDNDTLTLLGEMIDVYEKIDFVKNRIQTHATLSAARGIIRLYQATSDKKYLALAEKIAKLYVENGMTENYANFNWFGRFDTWAEPCAITDSLIVMLELFRETENKTYLTLAQRIYYNAFCYAQRVNGGFGCDSTVGPAMKYLKPAWEGISEAFWCCTMRGAEGLRWVANSLFMKKDNEIFITFGLPATLETENYKLEVKSGLPYDGNYKIVLSAKVAGKYIVKMFDGKTFDFNLGKGETAECEGVVDLTLREEKAAYIPGNKKFRGNLMLGINDGEEIEKLRPLTDMRDVSVQDAAKEARQIVF